MDVSDKLLGGETRRNRFDLAVNQIVPSSKNAQTWRVQSPYVTYGTGAHGCCSQVDGSLNLHAAAVELALPLEDVTLRSPDVAGLVKFGL